MSIWHQWKTRHLHQEYNVTIYNRKRQLYDHVQSILLLGTVWNKTRRHPRSSRKTLNLYRDESTLTKRLHGRESANRVHDDSSNQLGLVHNDNTPYLDAEGNSWHLYLYFTTKLSQNPRYALSYLDLDHRTKMSNFLIENNRCDSMINNKMYNQMQSIFYPSWTNRKSVSQKLIS